MLTFVSIFSSALALLIALPIAVFLLEVGAAIFLPQRQMSEMAIGDSRPRIAILVPAHNEGSGLLPTLADITAQTRGTDRLLVVADNCTDDTAIVALAAGAEVIERVDPEKRGKGYALAAGLRHLDVDPPDIVIMVDADCRLAESAFDRLAQMCVATNRPVQALYLMTAPDDAPVSFRVAEFAWRVKNWLRPLGLKALGLPCQLTGTGMAFRWNVIRSADLASGSIVEDMKLGLDLALAGSAPVFCPDAVVTSEFPHSIAGVQSQRVRWEQGHIGTIAARVPNLIFTAIRQANFNLLVLAIDVAVPPLSLLGLIAVAGWGVAGSAALFGLSSAALLVSTLTSAAFLGGGVLAWFKCGRDVLPLNAIFLMGAYVIGKLPMYRRLLSPKASQPWVRTDRRKT